MKGPWKIYAEELKNLESWHVKQSKENITRDGQDWWWWPNQNMEETFHEIYLNCVENKHIEWAKEKQSNRESYKKGMSQRTRDSENQLEVVEK